MDSSVLTVLRTILYASTADSSVACKVLLRLSMLFRIVAARWMPEQYEKVFE